MAVRGGLEQRERLSLPCLCSSLGSSDPVSLSTITGAFGCSLAYMRGCSAKLSSSLITNVVALMRFVEKEVVEREGLATWLTLAAIVGYGISIYRCCLGGGGL